jgi:hypothetical protein
MRGGIIITTRLACTNSSFLCCRALLSSTRARGFKALKQIVKLLFKMGQREKMMEAYR